MNIYYNYVTTEGSVFLIRILAFFQQIKGQEYMTKKITVLEFYESFTYLPASTLEPGYY